MTEHSQNLLTYFQVRKTKSQKQAFRAWLADWLGARGYTCNEERGMLGARNVVVGDPNTANVVYTAHYDTAPRLPFPNFITPKKISLYLLYQLAIVLAILAAMALLAAVLGLLLGFADAWLELSDEAVDVIADLFSFLAWATIFCLLSAGPANKHTANDNTSGVATLLSILDTLPPEARGTIAVVFFDLEEIGLFGSSSFSQKHKAEMRDKLLVNFDCVSDGDHFLFALRKAATPYQPLLEKHFTDTDAFTVEHLSKGVFYPSDQAKFPCGVGVAALKYSKRLGTHYMDRIHTKKDIVFSEENITYLAERSVALALDTETILTCKQAFAAPNETA